MSHNERAATVARLFDSALREAWPQGIPAAVPTVLRARDVALSLALTVKERRQAHRRAAEVLLLIACSTPTSWEQVLDAWNGVTRLGFANVDRRIQNALLLARWCINNRSHFETARRALEDGLARLGRLPRASTLRVGLVPRVKSFLDQLQGPNVE